ncbi:glycosyltransferase [Dendronalium sp. ChiSLP03b]|uniref:glycosyltransferase n=1 Tax=Dendronalium sp. ChiSLP03b TaxID=3075381 RepID=UPI002AD48DB1|nr:glycosyltransferase [Dendronalium sp. ChiSLP03b]MDZ8204871.1 glycosyltransferase [Dendronalium sp. ChiSLP03b]
MQTITKPKLVFFQWKHERAPDFIKLHLQLHVKCLSEFFDVIVINEDCDYQQICDQYQPDLTLFESGVKYIAQKINIKNTSAYPEIPKLGFHNGDSWCDCRAGFLSDMEHWGIETFFSICTTTAEHTPEIAKNLFVWPNFIDADIYRDYNQPKIIPTMLTGSTYYLYPWRQRIYKIISQYYPSLTFPHGGYDKSSTSRMIYGEQYARSINASWFVPTCGSVAKEIVRKHFEIPGAKSCLLTEKTRSLEAAGFVDMENCVFVDEHDLLDKLDYLFQNLDVLERITNAGYQLVHSQHTLKQRDQIFQWFNLHQNLKPNQKIVQKNPFEPLTIVEKSSGIENSHLICNGLSIDLLRKGDEKLWKGQYEEAETLYLRCLNYTVCMPEPKLRLALCKLYQGDAAAAQHWIVQPIKYTLEDYKAIDPEPVEWAYFIISLLCQGKLNEAKHRAQQFPSLSHPELDRTRWAINSLTNKADKVDLSYHEQSKYRYSLHPLPKRDFKDWVENLCIILKKCNQPNWAENLSKLVYSESEVLHNNQKKTFSINTKFLIKSLTNIYRKLFTKLPQPWKQKNKLRPDYLIKVRRFVYFKLIIPSTKVLHALETRFGYFLPYRFSLMKNDEFLHDVQKMVREEDIKTALLIGAATGDGNTEAFLTGIWENQNKPTAFCINTSTPQFIKLQNRYANDSLVKCYDIASSSQGHLPDALENTIKKIHQDNQINCFDLVLIDSSEVNTSIELDQVYGTMFILLDDISTFENYQNHHRLITDSNYTLISQNPSLRNGYAIFKKLKHEIIY